MSNKIYCPICARFIYPSNSSMEECDDEDGGIEGVGFIYIHDDLDHSDDDISALEHGIN